MSRSARYAIGVALVLVLIGGGSGLAVAHWTHKEAPPDWDAVVRGGACVAGELRQVVGDVAGLLSPDRATPAGRDAPAVAAPDRLATDQDRPSGGSSESDGSGGSPLQALLAEGREEVASLTDGVPRLDESASGGRGGC